MSPGRGLCTKLACFKTPQGPKSETAYEKLCRVLLKLFMVVQQDAICLALTTEAAKIHLAVRRS